MLLSLFVPSSEIDAEADVYNAAVTSRREEGDDIEDGIADSGGDVDNDVTGRLVRL